MCTLGDLLDVFISQQVSTSQCLSDSLPMDGASHSTTIVHQRILENQTTSSRMVLRRWFVTHQSITSDDRLTLKRANNASLTKQEMRLDRLCRRISKFDKILL